MQLADEGEHLPGWVPDGVRHYLAHTESGLTIRALARGAEVHASTILRQVRRFESRRDDPLVDRALRRLSQHCAVRGPGLSKETSDMDASDVGVMPGIAEIEREGLRILRRLAEPGTVLAVAREMEMGVVVRDIGDGAPPQRVAVVARAIAEAMALKDWIGCETPEARVARYRITGTGRGALKMLMAAAENRAQGFAESQTALSGNSDDPNLRHMRTALAESPLAGLARRNDKDGQPFLSRTLVGVAERLREDFELANTGPQDFAQWERVLDAAAGEGVALVGPTAGSTGARAAHDRVQAALTDLGPGLADVALRCCCFLEGLEALEKRMGWSARSGKIVLRIALQRLQQHYLRTQGKYGPMIG
jgi:hypothetical protein